MKTTQYLIAGCLAMGMAACSSANEDSNSTTLTHEDETPVVDIDVARTRTVELGREYTANVEADKLNNISPAMANRIETITVDLGDHVRRGQVLVTLDPYTAEQQRVNLEQMQRDYDRAAKLLEIGAGTQSTVDQLKAQLDAQTTAYNNTVANTVLRSPVDGVVIARNFDPGDMATGQAILTIGQVQPNVKVLININESDLANVKAGMPVSVTFDAYEGETFDARISRLSPAVDAATRTFAAEVLIPNPKGKLHPGMFARVDIKLGERENTVVPDAAVIKQTGSAKKFVYTYSDGQVQFKPVVLGQRLDDGFEVLSGINDGDTVVTAGQTRLIDGAEVQLIKR